MTDYKKINKVNVDMNAYAEAFSGKYIRAIITADNEKMLKFAAERTVALPSTVVGRPEGGIECYLNTRETPDGRSGAMIQLWMGENTPQEKFEREISLRIRQGTLVVPGTAIFDACESPNEVYDTMRTVGYCADGFQEVVLRNGRNMIEVPIMAPNFFIEKEFGIGRGVSGGNLWFYIDDSRPVPETMSELWDKALTAVDRTPGAIHSFGICSAGSKVGSIMADTLAGTPEGGAYKALGPSTNHLLCPTLKGKVAGSLVPEGIASIPEIVINGVDKEAVMDAMRNTIYAVSNIAGLSLVSAGDYGGSLGKYKIYLKDLDL